MAVNTTASHFDSLSSVPQAKSFFQKFSLLFYNKYGKIQCSLFIIHHSLNRTVRVETIEPFNLQTIPKHVKADEFSPGCRNGKD